MDLKLQNHENPEAIASDEQQQQNSLTIVSSPPFATASLTFSRIIPATNFFLQPKISALFSQHPNKVRVPTQASSLAHLSLSSSTLAPSKISFKSTISANPLQNPLSLGPRRPLDPNNGAGIRRAAIVWFRSDLRVQDNECLNTANNESMSVLPVFCFDPKDYQKSSSGLSKTESDRASFLIEAVSDLRKNLQARGSDLVVRIGKPENVLVELAKAIGADAVYAHREVSNNEVKAEERIEASMKEENVELKYFWGSTLYHVDDLSFKVENMPENFGGFREKVQGLSVRKTIEALEKMKGMPSRGDVEPGEIPSVGALGLSPSASMAQRDASMAGGETIAQERLKKFAAECKAQPPKSGNESIYGANFSSKIAPWLSMGCISPRSMFDELNKTASRNDGGSNWMMSELMWRDFFRFITKKCSSPAKQLEGAPAMA